MKGLMENFIFYAVQNIAKISCNYYTIKKHNLILFNLMIFVGSKLFKALSYFKNEEMCIWISIWTSMFFTH